MTQKFAKSESTRFKDYTSARKAADTIAEKIGKSTDRRVRVRLRSKDVFDVVTYDRLPPPKEEKKNADKPS